MDVPFINSGALSRAHYALVHKVEAAASPQLADQYLFAEVQSLRTRLAKPGLSIKECKEILIVLLYCSMAITSGFASRGQFDFAIPQAVNLAEAGISVQDKRIGYAFCAELMSPGHELQLMLVNTLRKDLESASLPRICLALDTLILSSTPDVIPAVQFRIQDLLSHNSPHVRRRSLLAFRALSCHEPELMMRIKPMILKCLKDSNLSVSAAAVIAAGLDVLSRDTRSPLNSLLDSTWSRSYESGNQWFLLRLLHAFRTVKLTKENVRITLEIIHFASTNHVQALLYAAFVLLSGLSESMGVSGAAVLDIRSLLASRDPNDQYVFLSCLECLEPSAWAGTTPDAPALLEEGEVARVMQLLDHPDQLIRRKTLRLLCRIDREIVAAYYARMLKALPPDLNAKGKNEYVTRLLEIVDVACGEDGEAYASQLKDLLLVADDASLVLDSIVEVVLLRIRHTSETFRISCVGGLLASLGEPTVVIKTTGMVLLSALACEYVGQSSLPPVEMLRGLAIRLSSCPATVQDVALLSMLRILANCKTIPDDVSEKVTELRQASGRHIRRRCDLLLDLSARRDDLSGVVAKANSSSLPDFVRSLDNYQSTVSVPSSTRGSSQPSAGSPSPTSPKARSSKLRYAAYDAPKPTRSLRRQTSSQYSTSSSRSDLGSVSVTRSSSSHGRSPVDELSKTVTAGDLTLAAAENELEMMGKRLPRHKTKTLPIEDLAARIDLIAFDSPFMSDPGEDLGSTPAEPEPGPSFEVTWKALEKTNARGWCDSSMDVALRRLQGQDMRLKVIPVDQPPFEGDLKVSISWGPPEALSIALLLLKEGDDESCLWRLRCADTDLRLRIKGLLTDG